MVSSGSPWQRYGCTSHQVPYLTRGKREAMKRCQAAIFNPEIPQVCPFKQSVMCSDFLADINNNHEKECRMDWGPKFVSGIKAITALGQLLLVTRSELDVSTLEIPGNYDSCGKVPTIGEKVQICSRLYLEAFAKCEQSLGKLSETAWELAHSRGSLHHVTELFHKGNSAVAYSSFRDEWDRVHQYLNNVGQHASACFESWTYLLSFIQEFEALLNDIITDKKKSTIRLTEKLEAAKAETKIRHCDIDLEARDEKDTQCFNFTYAIRILITMLSVLFLSGIVFKVITISGMFLCALLVLRAGIKKSDYRALLDDNDEDQTRDLEIEIERLTQKHKINATICQTLQEMGSSLASATGGIRDTHDSNKVMFDRLNSLNEDKIGRFKRTMHKISYSVSWDESNPPNRTTNYRPRDSKDVNELRELTVELRLTFYIMYQWSSLYTRISQDVFTPALHEVQSFSSLATLISSIDLSSDRLNLRPAQEGFSNPQQTAPLLSRGSITEGHRPPAYFADTDVYLSRPFSSEFKDELTLNEVAQRAEIELNKLQREAEESAIRSIQERVTEVYTTTMPTLVIEPKERRRHILNTEREGLPAPEGPNRQPIAVCHRFWRFRTRD